MLAYTRYGQQVNFEFFGVLSDLDRWPEMLLQLLQVVIIVAAFLAICFKSLKLAKTKTEWVVCWYALVCFVIFKGYITSGEKLSMAI